VPEEKPPSNCAAWNRSSDLSITRTNLETEGVAIARIASSNPARGTFPRLQLEMVSFPAVLFIFFASYAHADIDTQTLHTHAYTHVRTSVLLFTVQPL